MLRLGRQQPTQRNKTIVSKVAQKNPKAAELYLFLVYFDPLFLSDTVPIFALALRSAADLLLFSHSPSLCCGLRSLEAVHLLPELFSSCCTTRETRRQQACPRPWCLSRAAARVGSCASCKPMPLAASANVCPNLCLQVASEPHWCSNSLPQDAVCLPQHGGWGRCRA